MGGRPSAAALALDVPAYTRPLAASKATAVAEPPGKPGTGTAACPTAEASSMRVTPLGSARYSAAPRRAIDGTPGLIAVPAIVASQGEHVAGFAMRWMRLERLVV